MSVPVQNAPDDWEPADFGESAAPMNRERPNDLAAEQAALGAMLLSKNAIAEVCEVITDPGVYYRRGHETIHRAVLALHAEGSKVDPITVANRLGEWGELVKVGGASYLHTVVNSVPTAANGEYYAEIVVKHAKRRRIIEAGQRIVTAGFSLEAEPEEAWHAAVAELQQIKANGEEEKGLSVAARWEDFIEQLSQGEDPNAVSTPWSDLNEVLTISGGMLITIGATTGGGKTLFAMNLGSHVALRLGRPALVASLEMGGNELLARLTAAEALVPLEHLTKRQITDDDWERIAKASDRMANAHHFILDDSPQLSVSKLRARVRAMDAQGKRPAIIIVDYVQLLTPDDGKNTGNRAQEVAAISRSLKLLAMEFETPVVTLAQFNRGASGRRPTLSDFKESSAIEQDSNAVILLHEERDPETNELVKPGAIEVIIAKNRQGMAGRSFELSARKHYGRLDDMAKGF